jgi:MoaA/NifB/PqqE/SkfB family radical SAM enzyme
MKLDWLQKLRLKFFIATKTLKYSSDYTDRIYKIYLNHNKVIHWRDGYPVYSLSTPALYSKPAANFFARSMFRTIQNKNLPNIMSYAINDVCNADCKHCSFFGGVDDKKRKILALDQSKKLIKDAQELGVSIINFVGGEPLMRDDLPEIIKSVDKDLSTTILFTNGWHLEEKAQDLKEAGLDGVYVSIDSASSKKHDEIRGGKGFFERATKGVRKAKDLGLTVGLSCVITPESFANGELERIIELGKEIGVHEVLVFDAMPTGKYKGRKDLIDNDLWIEDLIKGVEQYNLDPAYPGILVWAYATSFRSVGCSCGTSYFYVSPYGDICSCDFNHAKFGNILKQPLYKIWDYMSSLDDFRQAKWGGCKIKDSKFRAKSTVVTEN